MDWHVSLEGLLTGSLAACIGLPGTIIAALLVIRHERVQRATEVADAARAAEVASIAEASARIVGAANGLMMELIRPQVFVGAARIDLLEAQAHFYAATCVRHQAVADWTGAAVQEAILLAGRSTKFWLLPGSTNRRAAAGNPLGRIMAVIPSWAAGKVSDDWFATDLNRGFGDDRSDLTV